MLLQVYQHCLFRAEHLMLYLLDLSATTQKRIEAYAQILQLLRFDDDSSAAAMPVLNQRWHGFVIDVGEQHWHMTSWNER